MAGKFRGLHLNVSTERIRMYLVHTRNVVNIFLCIGLNVVARKRAYFRIVAFHSDNNQLLTDRRPFYLRAFIRALFVPL